MYTASPGFYCGPKYLLGDYHHWTVSIRRSRFYDCCPHGVLSVALENGIQRVRVCIVFIELPFLIRYRLIRSDNLIHTLVAYAINTGLVTM